MSEESKPGPQKEFLRDSENNPEPKSNTNDIKNKLRQAFKITCPNSKFVPLFSTFIIAPTIVIFVLTFTYYGATSGKLLSLIF